MIVKTSAILLLLFLLYLMVAADTGHLPSMAVAAYEFPNGDKLGHFGLYGAVAFLLALAFPRAWQIGRIQIPIIVAVFLLFSVAEEWSQSLFYRRTSDPVDALCSCAGILTGAWVAFRVRKSRKGL